MRGRSVPDVDPAELAAEHPHDARARVQVERGDPQQGGLAASRWPRARSSARRGPPSSRRPTSRALPSRTTADALAARAAAGRRPWRATLSAAPYADRSPTSSTDGHHPHRPRPPGRTPAHPRHRVLRRGRVRARRRRPRPASTPTPPPAAAGPGPPLGALRRLSFHLSGAQLGITVTSLIVGFIAEPTVAEALEPLVGRRRCASASCTASAIGVALVLATLVSMVVGELVPKSLAIAKPRAVAYALVPADGADRAGSSAR